MGNLPATILPKKSNFPSSSSYQLPRAPLKLVGSWNLLLHSYWNFDHLYLVQVKTRISAVCLCVLSVTSHPEDSILRPSSPFSIPSTHSISFCSVLPEPWMGGWEEIGIADCSRLSTPSHFILICWPIMILHEPLLTAKESFSDQGWDQTYLWGQK